MSSVRIKLLQVAVKVFFCTLSFLMLPLFQAAVVEASAGTVVKVEPHASFARVGGTFTVNLTVVNVQNLYGVEVTLYWNASILEMVGVDVQLGEPDGILCKPLSPLYENKTFQEQGKYALSCSSTAPASSFNGSGNIVRVTFNVTGVGSCELSLESKLASNIMTPTGVAPIAHTTVGGFFGPIQIVALPKRVTVGENVNISGFIAPAQANVSVTISYRHEKETEWRTETVETDEEGSYLYMWAPEKSGKYYVRSAAVILGNEEASLIVSISVNKPEQPPWLYVGIPAVIIAVAIAVLLIYRRQTRSRRKKL